MNVRVFLLVLFSLMFMGVWDADQRSADIALARRNSNQLPACQSPVSRSQDTPATIAPEPLTVQPDQAAVIHVVPVRESADTNAQATMPLDLQTAFLLATTVPWLTPAEVNVPLPTESITSASEMVDAASTDTIPATVDSVAAELTSEPFIRDVPADASSAGAAAVSALVLSIDAAQMLIPLPKNLASGTWQVMSESGEHFRMQIDQALIAGTSAENIDEPLEESFCVTTTTDGVRWCFVRFRETSATPASADRVATESFKSIP